MGKHISVLLNECIEGLNIKSDGLYVDCTLGGAGHSYHILEKLNKGGHLYGFDQDDYAIETSRKRLSALSPNFTLIHKNFSNLKQEMENLGISGVDGILFDLGVSSFQLDQGERGFSYNQDALLDMRMDKRNPITAQILVNTLKEEELTKIFFEYGEEKFSRNIARNIVKARAIKPINTTFELVDIIKESIPVKARITGGHPAKRIFQALRIAVNDELGILRKTMEDALSLLNPGGRLCVITFHSLEDRIVKDVFKKASSAPTWNRNMPITLDEVKVDYKLVNRKAIEASEEELINNNRAHSAKLRIIEKI